MKTYRRDRACPKCGGDGEYSMAPACKWVRESLGVPEHILRTCLRCGYTWRERPLDAEGE